jgi:hypothetical protein
MEKDSLATLCWQPTECAVKAAPLFSGTRINPNPQVMPFIELGLIPHDLLKIQIQPGWSRMETDIARGLVIGYRFEMP